MPPTIPPINCPMALPTDNINLPPSLISQDNPGICAKLPIAANTIDNSAMTAPTPNTPIIATGTNPATAAKAATKAVIIPVANKPPINTP